MSLVFGADAYVVEWVRQRVPHIIHGFGACASIGVERNGVLIAGVVYHEYRPGYGSLLMSVAAEPKSRWLTRHNLEAFFRYPFVQLGCQRVGSAVARKNKVSRSFVEKLGFKYEGCIRKGFGTDDAMLYGLLESECRWIQPMRKAA